MKLILTLLVGLLFSPSLFGQQQIDAWKCIRSTELVCYPQYEGVYSSPITYESLLYSDCKQAGETLADTRARVNAQANADVLAWVESWEDYYYPVDEWWAKDEGFYNNCNGQLADLNSSDAEPVAYSYPASMSWEEIEAAEDARQAEIIDGYGAEVTVTNIGWKYKVTCLEYVEADDAWYDAAVMRTVCPSSAFPTTLLCELEAKDRVQAALDAMDDYLTVNPVIDTALACPSGG